MKRYLTISAFAGLFLSGCFSGPAPDSASSSDHSSMNDRPSMSQPRGGMSAAEEPGGAASQTLDDAGGPVDLDAIVLTAPSGWRRVKPSSSFVAAEFSLPGTDGDNADARLTVSTAGGSVEANIQRWKGQFDPLTEETPQEEIDVAGIQVAVVDLAGNFNDQRGPFAPAVQRPDYRMIAAIIPVNGQLHFVKATGPQQTMAAHADEIREFVRSVRQK